MSQPRPPQLENVRDRKFPIHACRTQSKILASKIDVKPSQNAVPQRLPELGHQRLVCS
jgi:hypothetical protein